MMWKTCKVIVEYKTPFSNPLIIKKGENIIVEEKESEWPGWLWCRNKQNNCGWVPTNYLRIQDNNCIALQDYDATELTVSIGEDLFIEKQESGWIWASNKEGKKGWVPLENVKIVE
ncbi:MAG: SH3 domain-containing protein [Promethearchaeota archaeon]|jgi:hypothetical protein